MQEFTIIIKNINSFIWGPYFLITLLCGTGLYFTLRLKFVQIFKFKNGLKKLFSNFSLHGKAAGKDGMSSFQAVATAIAAQVGTGNLVGASTALISGGPGAIFWMWLAAFFGMATNFAEICIGQVYKSKDDSGQVVGGPAYYISQGLGNGKFAKLMAGFFAVAIIFALGFMGNMVQSNSIADGFSSAFKIPAWFTGLTLASVGALIFIGGVKRITRITEKIVPMMAILYVVIGLFIVMLNYEAVPSMFVLIVEAAFNPSAAWGGVLGVSVATAARYGIARGLFSNEAGMGSTPHSHAVANVKHPVDQGVLGIVAVFVDTFIVLNVTVFTILSSGVIKFVNNEPVLKGISLVQESFSTHLFGESFGYSFVAICLFFFAFTTIIGWYYFAEINIRYLFGKKGIRPFQIIVIGFIFIGSVLKIDLVWELADFFNGLMVLPNLIAIIVLSPIVVKLLADYDKGISYKADNYKEPLNLKFIEYLKRKFG